MPIAGPEHGTRSRVRHELKCWPEYFQPTLNGINHIQLRRDDRPEGYQVGDELLLKEWIPNTGPEVNPCAGYTGREVLVRVDYVMSAETIDGLMHIHPSSRFPSKSGFVIMSISRI